MQKFTRFLVLIVGICFLLVAFWHPVQGESGVYVEAINFANVRSGPAVTYPELGTIYAGQKYLVTGQNSQYPWLLITLKNGQGWVYKDIIKITGDLSTVPYTDIVITPGTQEPQAFTATATSTTGISGTASTATMTLTPSITPSISVTPSMSSTPAPVSTLTPVSTGVTAEAIDETNVRFGPGTDFQRIGTIYKGHAYAVTRRHASFTKWIEIDVPDMGGGRGWVYRDTVTIKGNLSTVPITDDRDFGYPTLTSTPVMVVTGLPPWVATPGGNDPKLEALINQIYDYLLQQKYEPGTDQQASLFLMDLQTSTSYSVNSNIAYSGMSLIKIPILVTLYSKLSKVPNKVESGWIGEMMVCSNNTATNSILAYLGNGDPYKGANQVTQTMQGLGLKDTFLIAPLKDVGITPEPVTTLKTGVDQTSAGPDLYNQTSPASLGWLLNAMYRCSVDGSGPLNDLFPGEFSENKCRAMIRALSADHIGILFEAGLPPGTLIAHKHGWIDDTRGDAALIFTPGGAYILTIEMHGKTDQFLNYQDSFLVASEVSRLVYNFYNPANPLDKVKENPASPDCTPGDDLLADLQRDDLPLLQAAVPAQPSPSPTTIVVPPK